MRGYYSSFGDLEELVPEPLASEEEIMEMSGVVKRGLARRLEHETKLIVVDTNKPLAAKRCRSGNTGPSL